MPQTEMPAISKPVIGLLQPSQAHIEYIGWVSLTWTHQPLEFIHSSLLQFTSIRGPESDSQLAIGEKFRDTGVKGRQLYSIKSLYDNVKSFDYCILHNFNSLFHAIPIIRYTCIHHMSLYNCNFFVHSVQD